MSRKMRDRKGVEAALCAGVEAALHRHAQAGVPAVVWRDGKITELPAEVLLAEHERRTRGNKGHTAA